MELHDALNFYVNLCFDVYVYMYISKDAWI